MAAQFNTAQAVAHVRFAGRSFDISLSELDLGAMSADGQIRRALARYLGVPTGKLEAYVVDRHANGNLTVRPEAVFGSPMPTTGWPKTRSACPTPVAAAETRPVAAL